MITTKFAYAIVPGDVVVERDGYELTVIESTEGPHGVEFVSDSKGTTRRVTSRVGRNARIRVSVPEVRTECRCTRATDRCAGCQ